MSDNTNHKVQRSPQVASREVITENDIDTSLVQPPTLFAEAVERVTHDLIGRVGYDRKITITIDELRPTDPSGPGYMIAAKARI